MMETNESSSSWSAQGLLWGTVAGVVLFSVTGEIYWLAIGTALGIVFGSASASTR